jgi:hypothetical protein
MDISAQRKNWHTQEAGAAGNISGIRENPVKRTLTTEADSQRATRSTTDQEKPTKGSARETGKAIQFWAAEKAKHALRHM